MHKHAEYLYAGWLWAILLVFHGTVFNYIALQVYKKNPYFKSVFFKLYLLHSLASYSIVGMVSEDYDWPRIPHPERSVPFPLRTSQNG